MPFRRADNPAAPWSVSELQLQVVDNRRFHIITPFRYVTGLELSANDAKKNPPESFFANYSDKSHLRPPVLENNAPALENGQRNILVPGWPLDQRPHKLREHATRHCRACTDFASVPRMVRGILGTYGPQLAAALVHDELCHRVAELPKPKWFHERFFAARKKRRPARDYCDATFLEAMRTNQNAELDPPKQPPERVFAYQARLFWAGVSMARYASYRTLLLILLFIEVIAGWLAILSGLQVLTTWISDPMQEAFDGHWYETLC